MPTFNLRTPSISSAFSMKRDVNKWVNKAKLSVKELEDKKLYKEAARYVRDEMRKYIWANQAKVGSYYIYHDPDTGKMKRTYRPEWTVRYSGGKRVAAYKIGNLKRSVKILHHLRRSPYAIVGPKKSKGSSKGYFDNYTRVDPYYAHMVDQGTQNKTIGRNLRPMRFIENTRKRTYSQVRNMLMKTARSSVRRRALKYGIAS